MDILNRKDRGIIIEQTHNTAHTIGPKFINSSENIIEIVTFAIKIKMIDKITGKCKLQRFQH